MLAALDLLPLILYLPRRFELPSIAENVRVPTNQLAGHLFQNVVNGEGPRAPGHVSVERDVREHIAELLREPVDIPGVYRFDEFVALFDQVRPQRFVRLLPVPGTATRIAKAFDYPHQVLEGGLPAIRRFFHG